MDEAGSRAHSHDEQARYDADAKQPADDPFHAAYARVPFVRSRRLGFDSACHPCHPLSSISSDTQSRTTTNRSRMLRPLSFPRSLDPRVAPNSTPAATGAATKGSMSPREKYTPALAAAVTPIMK